MADIDLEAAQAVVALCRGQTTNQDFKAEAIEIDVTNEHSVKQATASSLAFLGRIDYCVNCAGVSFLRRQPPRQRRS